MQLRIITVWVNLIILNGFQTLFIIMFFVVRKLVVIFSQFFGKFFLEGILVNLCSLVRQIIHF